MNDITPEDRIKLWDIELGLEEPDLNVIDRFYKDISKLILTRGGELLTADNPIQLKIGYVWFAIENGKEVYENPELSITKFKKYFNESKICKFFGGPSCIMSQDGKIKICQELQNPRSEIHKLYFTDGQLKEMLMFHNMHEALE